MNVRRVVGRLQVSVIRAWRKASRTQRNVDAAREAAVRSADSDYERIAMRGRNWPPG